jgi:GDP-4-dehydro-6-deoxy-D-mannose reductase
VRVLVTGAAGFAGRHLLRYLAERGAERLVGTQLPGQAPPRTVADDPPVEWSEMDVTSTESIRQVLADGPFDEVYHLAGQSSVGESFGDPLRTWEINATGTLRLLLELERAHSGEGPRVLVVSSAEVYGAVPAASQPVRETHAPAPMTPYGASKLGAEAVALEAAAGEGVRVVVARSFNHAGPGQDARFIFPSLALQLARIARGEGVPVLQVGNLEARRDFLDVRDVAAAYVTLLREGHSGQVYNVCSGQSHSLRELVERLVEISGTGARIEVDADRFRPVDIPELRGDPARLLALGWRREVPLERTLADLYAAAEREAAGVAAAP